MDKKQYVLKVLDAIKDTMPLARGLIILLQNAEVDEKLIDTLITAFSESMKGIKDEEVKNRLEKGKHILEEMKRMEQESQARDAADLKNLDMMLTQM